MASPPSWTIFGGATLATVEGPNDQNKEPLMGLALGIALDWKINSTFMFQPELQYAEKGYQYNQGVPVRLELTYVEIPLLLRASTAPLESGTRLYGLLGPSLARRRSCGASVGSANSRCKVLAQNMSTMDFGMVAGLGLDFKILASKWTASLRYNLGMSDQDRSIVQDTGAQLIGGISAVTAPMLINDTCKMEILTPYCVALWSY